MTSWLPLHTLDDDATKGMRLMGYGRYIADERAPCDARVMIQWNGGWVVKDQRGQFAQQFYPSHWQRYEAPV